MNPVNDVFFSSLSCYFCLSMFVVTFCSSNGKKESLFHIIDTVKKPKPIGRIEYMYVSVCVDFFCSFCYPFILDFFFNFLRLTTLSVVLIHTHTYIKVSSFFLSYFFRLGKYCIFLVLCLYSTKQNKIYYQSQSI